MREVRITNQKEAWAFTDWLDDEICKLCHEIARELETDDNKRPDIYEFTERIYEETDFGGIRDMLINAAETVMETTLVFDYPL